MKIYTIGLSNKYTSYNVAKKMGYDEIDTVESAIRLQDSWSDLPLIVSEIADTAEIGYIFLFGNTAFTASEKIQRVICEKFASEDFEFLPAHCDSEKMYILHDINPYKLNSYKFEFDPATSNDISKFDLSELEALGMNEKGLFKVTNDFGWVSPLYLTEKFVDTVTELGLDTIRFKLVWES